MAEPTPIFVTPSTTVVQVNTLQTPYTPVILNSFQYAGQLVTILDGTSSFGVTQSSIVVSTQVATQFLDGSISTLINQPQGFLTVQAQAPNVWSFLNAFPFWNQYPSAITQNLTTSNLYSFATSTLQEITSSVTTQNLIVSGNLTLKGGITLNQTISSLGAVNLFSSVTGYESAFFSSGFSSLGAVQLFSSLTVDGNFFTPSSLQFLSTLNVSTSVSVAGYVSTTLVSLSGSLTTHRLIVQGSTPTSVNAGGSLLVDTAVLGMSSLYGGGNFESFLTTVSSFSTLSSMAIFGSMVVTRDSIFQSNVSTQGSLVVRGTLSTGIHTLVLQDISAGNLFNVQQSTLVNGTLSTLDFQAQRGWIQGNLQVDPTTSLVTTAQDITIEKSFGIGDVIGMSTTIGGILSTTAQGVFSGNVFGNQALFIRQEVSTLSSVSTLGDVYVYGALSTFGPLWISSSAEFWQTLNVSSTSYWNQSNVSSSYIKGDLRVLGNLTASQTLTLSSIVLPSTVLANNFQVSSLFVGYGGMASTTLLSSLRTSSLATGGILNPSFTMDMSNVFQTINLSTFLLSSFEFQAKSEGILAPSTFFQATSSFGVNTIASTNTFDVNVLAYTLCNMNVLQILSANTMFGGLVTGTLQGDGSLLSNINYPAQLSTGLITTSSLISRKVETQSLILSSMTADLFASQSTLTVGTFSIFGNASVNPNTSSLYFATPTTEQNLLVIGNASVFGNGSGTVKKQMIVNSNFLPNFTTTNYTLGVGGTMRVTGISSPNFVFPFDTYRADVLVAGKFVSTGSLELATGTMGLSTGTFFISESDVVQVRSTNIIQPFVSTLQFNSTLFVNRIDQRVGVNTRPFYTLDVNSVAYASQSVTTLTSTLVQNQIQVRQTLSTFWFATNLFFGGGSGWSNLLWSSDGETWTNYSGTYTNGAGNISLNSIAYDGGKQYFGSGLTTSNMWVAVGQEGIPGGTGKIVSVVDLGGTLTADLATIASPIGTRQAFTGVAYNGSIWLATCPITGGNANDSIVLSTDGKTWLNSFEMQAGMTSGYVFQGGARGVAWNANGIQWVAVGIGDGSDPTTTIGVSYDGSNWAPARSGGFTGTSPSGGFGVVWTGCNWVATGDGGFGPGGYSFLTSPDGWVWTPRVGYGFLNPKGWGTAIAWNGYRLVAVGTAGFPFVQSIQYSDDYGATWSVASGDLFENSGDQGYSVNWNGNYWLATGVQGFRKSYDGKTWFQPLTAVGFPITSASWTSNSIPSMGIGSSTLTILEDDAPLPPPEYQPPSPILRSKLAFKEQLQFLNDPGYGFDLRDATPYVAYTSSLLNINTLKINEGNNVGTLPFLTLFTSSFVQQGTTLVSGFLSTTATFYQGGYYLDLQNV